jgi:hypothetical protein
MIRVHFVGDGERDAATVPHLVRNILRIEIHETTTHWPRLNSAGTGFPKKLRFAMKQTIDAAADGLVAVVDRDKAEKRSRLKELQAGRAEWRANVIAPPLPTALGEASPHGDAWLLDDPAAIRQALELADDVEIKTVRKTKEPKTTLNELIKGSKYRNEKDIKIVLADIARLVDHQRCAHRDETGFGEFVKDLIAEFGHFVRSEL